MRFILFVLVALALGKVGGEAYIRHQSVEDTLIAAYREHAIAACSLHAAEAGEPAGTLTFTAGGAAADVTVELAVGRPDLKVRLWQTSHEAWSARFSDPYLIVTAAGPEGAARCDYDIRNATVRDWQRAPGPKPGGRELAGELLPRSR